MTYIISEKIRLLESKLQTLEEEKTILNTELRNAQNALQEDVHKALTDEKMRLSAAEKINIFKSLFKGRMDVFPKRWNNSKTAKSGYSPACFNEWAKNKCNKPRIKCSDCPHQAFIPLTDDIIYKHLGGEDYMGSKREYTTGIYPLQADDTCWFLAADFDKKSWQQDVIGFIQTCRRKNVPFALERSRSGNGAHVWIFFEKPIAASDARKMGSALLTETMEHTPDMSFESYDRFFPNQDTLPSGGFGNLIALPLQYFPRKQGNSVFVNDQLEPYPDQWVFLASLTKMSEAALNDIVREASDNGKIIGVRMPIDEDEEKPWELKPSRKKPELPMNCVVPTPINVVICNQIFIEKQDIPPALMNKLIRLAAFQNPEFYKAQSMRLSTFGKPRIIACATNFSHHIALPRGCFDECKELLDSLHIDMNIDDKRSVGQCVDLNFLGELTPEQQKASMCLLKHDIGVLAATTAFGKTVIGAHMISIRKTNTLILVHRRHLLDQWHERLKFFLNLNPDQMGMIGGGKYKPSGVIDVALIQSLIKNNTVDDIVANYGHVIIDECHHVSAVSFEEVVKACTAKYVLGLTATATRKDRHHPIIMMQCGAMRYRVDAKQQAKLRPFMHNVVFKQTHFSLDTSEGEKISISQIYAMIMNDHDRNMSIIDDVVHAFTSGRSPLILTERKEHVAFFAEHLARFCKNIIVMVGGQTRKKREEVKHQLESIPDHEERLIIATGRYIGEGFDDTRLDTLFLTMPIAWEGTLAQYAGRLHRLHAQKKEVIVYDYVDDAIPMLARMAAKRQRGYIKLGYVRDNSHLCERKNKK